MLSEYKFCFRCYDSITVHSLGKSFGAFNRANTEALPEQMHHIGLKSNVLL